MSASSTIDTGWCFGASSLTHKSSLNRGSSNPPRIPKEFTVISSIDVDIHPRVNYD